jgi:hypothetical protein
MVILHLSAFLRGILLTIADTISKRIQSIVASTTNSYKRSTKEPTNRDGLDRDELTFGVTGYPVLLDELLSLKH